MKKLATFLFLSVLSMAVLAQGRVMSQPAPDDVTDLRLDTCTQVQAGHKIRFKFKMVFDGEIPNGARYNAEPIFQRPATTKDNTEDKIVPMPAGSIPRLIRLELFDAFASQLPEHDNFEYIGRVPITAKDGEYKMADLRGWAWYNIPFFPSPLNAQASLTPEAKEQIARYRVCISGGGPPPDPPKGKITSVDQPEK